MNTLKLTIDGMSCGHCLNRVKQALGTVNGVQVSSVQIGQATLQDDPATQDADLGFRPDHGVTSTPHVGLELDVRLFAGPDELAQAGHFGAQLFDLDLGRHRGGLGRHGSTG